MDPVEVSLFLMVCEIQSLLQVPLKVCPADEDVVHTFYLPLFWFTRSGRNAETEVVGDETLQMLN